MGKENANTVIGTTITNSDRMAVLTIRNTEYLIRSVFSVESKERFEDKLSKIILKEVRMEEKKMRNHFE